MKSITRPSFFFVLCLLPLPLFGQGPLAPTVGPTPTMRSLDQIEPRIPIPGGTAAFTIGASGSYVLTGNLTVASNAITVNASEVTLDLMASPSQPPAAPAFSSAASSRMFLFTTES